MTMKKWYLTIILSFIFITLSFTVNAAPQVSLEFNIGKTELSTTSGVMKLDAAPYIKSGTTMVPMRAIFEELGYMVEYVPATKRIISSNGYKRITMTIGSNKAYVDGVEKIMPAAPETVNGRTFVPLRFISENSNAVVGWVTAKDPIKVTLAVRPDIGSFILSEKKLDAEKKPVAVLDIFRKGRAERIEIKGKEITNVLPFKDSFVITVLDPVLYTTQVMGYDGELKLLLKDYEVKNSFEFNNHLMIHMYNRLKKIDELWRYDGSKMTIIDSDFNMGVFVVTDEQALVSKSNSKREYSIMRFTKSSWTPQELKADNEPYGFIIKDYIIDGDILYLLGTKAVGDDAWFYTYKINGSTGVLRPIKVSAGQVVTLKDVFQTDNYIYVKLKNVLHVLTETDLKPVEFFEYENGNSGYVNITLGDAQVINGKLYAIVTGLTPSIQNVKATVSSTGVITQTDVRYSSKILTGIDKTFMLCLDNSITFSPTVVYTVISDNYKPDYKNMRASIGLSAIAYSRNTIAEMKTFAGKDNKINSMRLFDNQLYLIGVDYSGDNYLNTWNVNGLTLGNPLLDIRTISEIVKLPNGAIVLAVEDYNRLNDTVRKTILELKNGVYRNIAVETEAIQMAIKSTSLMIYGQDTDLNRSKVFSYNGKSFDSVGNAFSLGKWYNYEDGLTFMSGRADSETKESVFLLTQALTKVMPGFTLEKMVRLNKNTYGVVGKFTAVDIDPDFKGKKVMVIFDAVTQKYTVVKASTTFELAASEY